MATLNKLNNSQVKSASKIGLLSDGGGLYLQASKAGTKSWLLRINLHGKRREMGLGSYNDTTLAEARDMAAEARKLVKQGIDPIEHRKASRKALAKAGLGQRSFKDCAEEYIASHKAGWKHVKHVDQWENSLKNYVYPVFGDLSVDQVDREDVQKVLTPIWNTKTETASRVRGRIERILDWARVQGYRSGENPALWRGNLQHIYVKPTKLINVRHMPSLPYDEMKNLLAKLITKDSLSARAIELMIYTVVRPNEAAGACWSEFDLKNKIWTIPKERMKGDTEHVIPLSDACIEMIEKLPNLGDDFLFPSTIKDKHITSSSLLKLVKALGEEIGFPNITSHGFRASFKTWTSEEQNFDWQAVEFCLAHQIKDKAAAAYHRSNLLEKRSTIMNAWTNYCSGIKKGNVVPMKKQSGENK